MPIAAAGVAAAAITGLITYTGNDPGEAGTALLRGAAVLLPIAVGLFIAASLPVERFARVLIAGGFVTFLATLSGSDNEVVYSVGRVLTWPAEAALIYIMLAFPSGRLRARVDRVLVGALGLVVALLFLPTALLTDAFQVPSIWTSCTEGCPGNAFQVVAAEPAWVGAVVVPLREVFASLVILAVIVRLVGRLSAARNPLRRTLVPVLAAAVVHSAGLVLAFGLRGDGNAPAAAVDLTWVVAAGLPLMALGFLAGALRWRLATGRALLRLAPRLQDDIEPAALRDLLADVLEDPTLDISYVGAGGRWVDTLGNPVAMPQAGPGRTCTMVRDGGGLAIAAIVHDESLAEQRSFVSAVGALGMMALSKHRLEDQVEASLLEVRRSRERILAAADDERRRIERDLHDGAQQRLVALRIKLQLASELSERRRLPDAAQLRQLSDDVSDALEDVRSLASGVYPALLVDGGLGDALRAVARRSPVPAGVTVDGVGRHPAEVEAAVYFCCLEALQNAAKHARAKSVSIVVSDGDSLSFEVRDDGCGFDVAGATDRHGLTNIRDRLAAVGGRLVVESSAAGTRVAGRIPSSRGVPTGP